MDEPVSSSPVIYLVTGGIGASGEQLVHTVLAQFPKESVRVITIANIRQTEQIADVLDQAGQSGGLVVHTLVDAALRKWLVDQAPQFHAEAIDLMGPLSEWVSRKTGLQPLGQPGLYRQLNRQYFDRVDAIEYSMAHDDGKQPQGWPRAEAVLVGVSRVGKTPLSLYLAVLGWKVANYPFVPTVPPPDILFTLDPRRVIGLTIEPGQLIQYRRQRQQQLGVSGSSAYFDPKAVFEEVEDAERVFRRSGFTIVDMTDKTIELGADEIIRRLSRVMS